MAPTSCLTDTARRQRTNLLGGEMEHSCQALGGFRSIVLGPQIFSPTFCIRRSQCSLRIRSVRKTSSRFTNVARVVWLLNVCLRFLLCRKCKTSPYKHMSPFPENTPQTCVRQRQKTSKFGRPQAIRRSCGFSPKVKGTGENKRRGEASEGVEAVHVAHNPRPGRLGHGCNRGTAS